MCERTWVFKIKYFFIDPLVNRRNLNRPRFFDPFIRFLNISHKSLSLKYIFFLSSITQDPICLSPVRNVSGIANRCRLSSLHRIAASRIYVQEVVYLSRLLIRESLSNRWRHMLSESATHTESLWIPTSGVSEFSTRLHLVHSWQMVPPARLAVASKESMLRERAGISNIHHVFARGTFRTAIFDWSIRETPIYACKHQVDWARRNQFPNW